ncbi:cytochrome C [Motiliproteus coralliicola]|uniref:Cytochrome C n=1 Tax=Motiliproteus coralliicola TaxID=2283196 RepID=A0A369WU15_9GAMM|nr:cytochrome C [Motiliproteus coralliicola]RDE25091.1 cytochrome C [Motiliproteus coralliicola]
MKARFALAVSTLLLIGNAQALSPEAEEGKTLYVACSACHDQALDPPKGPPMWGVQRRYKKQMADDQAFVDSMVSFVKSPSIETAVHREAVSQLGLMPAMPLPDGVLRKIATYILEEDFAPPCDHWQIAIKRAELAGDSDHAQKDRRMFQRFCR